MKFLLALVALIGYCFPPAALAANPAPFGMELGVATFAQVQKDIGSRTRLKDAGVNQYSDGRMLKGDGEGLEVEGLSEITFIFDKADKLAGVLMTLPKGGMHNENFTQTMEMLKGKYKLVEKRLPFVGDSYAKFRHGDGIVELDAPHLSFSMSLRYLTKQLLADFNKQSSAERAEKRHRQANQF